MSKWHLSIDTGGTFTDCIARRSIGRVRNPAYVEVKRVKVLSSSCLRGNLIEKLSPTEFQFSHNWPIRTDIFQGYTFRFAEHPDEEFLVKKIDFENGILTLEQQLRTNNNQLSTFELTTGEEAPILAARLATLTPLDQPLPPIEMRLGTTRGTNALLEKNGARTALLITQGFGDLLTIGTQQRPHLFQLNIPEPELLYATVIEVQERLDEQGGVLQKITPEEVSRVVDLVKNANVDSVAVALLHGWRNPDHELALRDALAEAGIRYLSCSHELMPTIKILPRAHTAVVNAYLQPVMTEYLENIARALRPPQTPMVIGTNPQKLQIMSSAGGLVPSSKFYPKDSLLSGPAGGVVGSVHIAQFLDFQRVITLDMGGTSTDVARFDGQYDYAYTTHIGGIEMASPCLSIETVAAGGGSICWFDGNKLCVGPESAGASPGPACYGAGGPLAITDVNLLLGKLDPSAMGIPVNRELDALAEVRKDIFRRTKIDYSDEELLRGFERIANEKMADAIRKISIAKGFDPKDYALLAFGGAGGLHACQIAEILGMQTVILPYDGGLLSAYGIGRAQVERMAQRQVLRKLEDMENELSELTDSLVREASAALRAEGFADGKMEVKTCLAYLRMVGQESSLEIALPWPLEEDLALERKFEEEYRRLFGHFPTRDVEVESVRVVVACDSPQSSVLSPQSIIRNHKSGGETVKFWDALRLGETLSGPTILLNTNSTAFLEKNWTLEVAAGQNLILRKKELAPTQSTNSPNHQFTQINPIELELFTNRFAAIAEEMGAQLQRTAFSVNIKERLDFSCALLDAECELLVNAPHIPVHLGSLGICARLVKEKLPLGPGDVAIVNHPKYGGSHLPDVTLVSAVFEQPDLTNFQNLSNLKPIGYVVNRAHHAEIGGKRPGSMPPDATKLEEEGVVILPAYLVRKGVVRWEAIEELLIGSPHPTRALHENLADINAALASLRTGEEKLRKLVAAHGRGKVQRYMEKLKETATEALANALLPFGNQKFSASEKMDDGRELAVSVAIENGRVKIDFSGTGPAHPFNLNANISIVFSAVIYVLRLLCGKDIPLNEGLMKNVDIVLPPGTFLHPDFEDNPGKCPAVVGGNTEVSQRLVDTLLKAFAPIAKVACSQGTMNNFLFGNEKFGYYETICGGTGAGEGHPGRSAVHQHMTNTKITDPEELELRYPVRLHRFAIRQNSGGEGRWRGGDGIVRELEFLEEVDLTILGQHREEAPYGMAGGEAGKRGRQFVLRDGEEEVLGGVDSRRLQPGDRVVIETPGGGGFGEKTETQKK